MKNFKILLTILSMGFVLASCGERSSSSVDSKVSTLGSETTTEVSSSEEPIHWVSQYSSGYLSFKKASDEEISVVDPEHPDDYDAVAKVDYLLNGNAGCTEAEVSFAVSDPAILPLSAITQEFNMVQTSNVIGGGAVSIDLKAVTAGEYYLKIHFDGKNGTSPSGDLIKIITVKAFGTVTTEHVSEALVFDYSGVTDADSLAALTGETAKVAVYNDEIPYGSDILPYRYMTIAAIYDSKTKKQTINIETILGTTVYFSVAMPKKNDPEHYTYYSIKSEKKTSDYTQTKYSVVFNKADLSVTIPVGNAN